MNRQKTKRVARVDVADGVSFGKGCPLALIAGPCVIESRKSCVSLAGRLARWAAREGIPYVFKASFDKANRSSGLSYRGPGLAEGAEVFLEIRERYGVPVITDIHEPWQAEALSDVVDILQIPAFLCRQTDLVVAAAEVGLAVNVKKGQFMAPEDMAQVVEKIESAGNKRILLTERGASFGYRNLVADMRSLPIMRSLGYPVVFDATHSVQRPGGLGTSSGGDGQWAPALARAAVATGYADGLFLETHPQPAEALSDKTNLIPLAKMNGLWQQLTAIAAITRSPGTS